MHPAQGQAASVAVHVWRPRSRDPVARLDPHAAARNVVGVVGVAIVRDGERLFGQTIGGGGAGFPQGGGERGERLAWLLILPPSASPAVTR
jgi:hypothetical protein